MRGAPDGHGQPSRVRIVVTALVVLLLAAGVWKAIDLRTQPPPPPHPIGTLPDDR